MGEMMLYVPTHRRIDYQLTLKNLPPAWLERTTIVCPRDEMHPLHRMFPDAFEIACPAPRDCESIAAKRAWIFRHASKVGYEKIMVLDDDLKFSARLHVHKSFAGFQNGNPKIWPQMVREDRSYGRIYDANGKQIDAMFKKIEEMLDGYRHGGISQRFMNHTHGHEFILNHKATHALAYHVPTVMEHCKLGRVRMFEDLDYTLQLLRAGFENAIYQWGATNDPRGFNAPGGESGTRTSQHIAEGADLMAKLHPGIVRVVERTGPDAERLGPKRIVVSWKKAIKQGRGT
jgi:TET-associated glycosyltransferase-like protein